MLVFHLQAGNSASGSSLFRELFIDTCVRRTCLLDGFLNRLFNTLNWTVTEMTVTLKEIYEATIPEAMLRGVAELQRQYRKATVLFNLSINLFRMLEFVAHQMPGVFLCGSKVRGASDATHLEIRSFSICCVPRHCALWAESLLQNGKGRGHVLDMFAQLASPVVWNAPKHGTVCN